MIFTLTSWALLLQSVEQWQNREFFRRAGLTWVFFFLVVLSFLVPAVSLVWGLLFLVLLANFFANKGLTGGGAEAMTLVVVGGLFLATLFPEQNWPWVYIQVQVGLSYLIAGLVKARHLSWWKGEELRRILLWSRYPIPARLRRLAAQQPWFVVPGSWCLLLFELGFVWIFFDFAGFGQWILFFGVLFHLVVAYIFGLNRFFWIWLAAYGAFYQLPPQLSF